MFSHLSRLLSRKSEISRSKCTFPFRLTVNRCWMVHNYNVNTRFYAHRQRLRRKNVERFVKTHKRKFNPQKLQCYMCLFYIRERNKSGKKNSCKSSNWFIYGGACAPFFAIVQLFYFHLNYSLVLIGPQMIHINEIVLWIYVCWLITKFFCCLKLCTKWKTQHKNEYEEQKKIYVTFVPLLTYDWHGMNESYGRWIEIWMRCVGFVYLCMYVVQRFVFRTLPLSQHSSSVFIVTECMRMRSCRLCNFVFCLCLLRLLIIFFFHSVFILVPRSMCVDSLLLLSVGCKWANVSYAGVTTARFRMFLSYVRYDKQIMFMECDRLNACIHARERDR